jgi:hypothetical protein
VNNERQKELQDALRLELRQRNRRSRLHMPPSMEPKRRWNAQD